VAVRVTRYALVVAAVATLLCSEIRAAVAEPSFKIDERTAWRLAAEAYDHGRDPKSFDYDPGMGRPFFVYDGINEPNGSFGFFAVNPWTGDVWDLWDCRRLSTPALRKSQAIIRSRFAPKELKQYKRLAAIRPECI